MVGGVREATNGTAPSLAVVLSALVVEILARGRRQWLSQAMKTQSGVPGRTQAPHLGSPRTQETVLGPEGSSLGPRPHTHPSALRRRRFRFLSGPELLGLRTGPLTQSVFLVREI